MSKRHPIIVLSGSSGSGKTTTKKALGRIFNKHHINAAMIDGDCFNRYDRVTMHRKVSESQKKGHYFTHHAPEGSHIKKLETLLRTYAESGEGQCRHYIHDQAESELYGAKPGKFTKWEDIPKNTDLLFYEGLHGCTKAGGCDIGKYADLKIGLAPVINIEWIQTLYRDRVERGYDYEHVVDSILRRMRDYVLYTVPQFERTDINIQREPIIDTSNPFNADHVPTPDESIVVIHIVDPKKWNLTLESYLKKIKGSYISKENTIVVPGIRMGEATELIIMDMLVSLGVLKKRVPLKKQPVSIV